MHKFVENPSTNEVARADTRNNSNNSQLFIKNKDFTSNKYYDITHFRT